MSGNGSRNHILAITPFERPDLALAEALAHTHAQPVLDLGWDRERANQVLAEVALRELDVGVRFARITDLAEIALPDCVKLVVLPEPAGPRAERLVRVGPEGRQILVQVTSKDEALMADDGVATGLIAKGSESGGRASNTTAFILLQQLVRHQRLPIWAQGGIGRHTAAAAIASGAVGVVLDSQLACLREASLAPELKQAISRLDGSESRVMQGHRVVLPRGVDADSLRVRSMGDLAELLRAADPVGQPLSAGQDICLAGLLAKRCETVGQLVNEIDEGLGSHIGQAQTLTPLGPGSKLAEALGTEYPIVQGPMSRVSDRAGFAEAVADAGAMPVLGLALMRCPHLEQMVAETAKRLRGRPWGVGLLGFAPNELQDEQKRVILEAGPSFALIAGGRPAQARVLEDAGIPTFLHVPSSGLLELFLQDGARRFIFEGHECGGHVGPKSSFVLWEEQVERLLAFESPEELSVLFAGGIHDARSAAMVSTLAAPLAAQGASVGVIMGTAYLYTEEAVATEAIMPVFQDTVCKCGETALLETGPGHATRCAASPFVKQFGEESARLEGLGVDPEQRWEKLERLNLGRLRLAAKAEHQQSADEDDFIVVDESTQRAEGLFMAGQLAAMRHRTVTMAALHKDVSEGSRDFLWALEVPARSGGPKRMGDIAIVGMACVFPDAPDLEAYWANILAGRHCIREVDADRWNPEIYYGENVGVADRGRKSSSKWGGFIPPVDFDPLVHGTPPNALSAIEPVQLLSLEVARRALEDAGYAEREFDRSRTSVVFGAQSGCDLSGGYTFRALYPMYLAGEMPEALDQALPAVTEDTFPGIIVNVIAGRIANRLDLGGVNFTVDAACASSLASVYTACQELLSEQSDMVLCGGADLHNSINDYLMFSSVGVLSPEGRCKTFASDADGIVLGEGIAVLVLKRLEDAERDKDRVYATIRGISGTSDGRAVGLTVPRREGQTRVLKDAYARAAVSPREIGLVEAHGTGTVLGDRNELAALTSVYTAAGVRPGSVGLGSVKSQIGHTKCAAGLAGLIKCTMALHHSTLPPTLHIREPNPGYDAKTSPFQLNGSARPWPGTQRAAAVSAFGFGGSNFHAVLAEYPRAEEATNGARPKAAIAALAEADSRRRAPGEWPAELFIFHGDTFEAARTAAARVSEILEHHPALPFRDIAATVAHHGRGATQLAMVAKDAEDLGIKLRAVTAGYPVSGVYETASLRGDVAFLFPGQGSQRVGMLADLFAAFPPLSSLLALADPWLDRLFPPTAYGATARLLQREALTHTEVAQPTLGVACLAVADLLAMVGVQSDLLGGHSYGELVALCVGGALDREDLLPLSAARGRAVVKAAEGRAGGMAAVRGSAEQVEPILIELGGQVVAANQNAPDQTVISGPLGELAVAIEAIKQRGLQVREVPVAAAFHSPQIAEAGRYFGSTLQHVPVYAPHSTVYSNTTAAPYPRRPFAIRRRLGEHIISPVRFEAMVRHMYADGARLFVEVGPGRVLTGLVRSILAGEPHLAVATNQAGQPSIPTLLDALAQLAVHGVPVDLEPLFTMRNCRPFDLEAPPARSPGVWAIDGFRALPASGPLPATAMRPMVEPIAVSGGVGSSPSQGDEVLVEFLRGMRESVASQREVLLSYLGSPAAPSPGLAPATAAATPGQAAMLSDSAVLRAAEAATPAAATEEEPAAAAQPQDIQTLLLNQVSERTGYPVEMLDLDLDLAADLSIDSIKRVEILGALSRETGLGGGDITQREALIEELAACKTLRGIIVIMEREQREEADGDGDDDVVVGDGLADAGVPDAEAALDVAVTGVINLNKLVPAKTKRFVLTLDEAPKALGDPSALAGRTIAVTDDGRGVALALTQLLEDRGAHVVALTNGELPEGVDGLVTLDGLREGWASDQLPEAVGNLQAGLKGGARICLAASNLGGRFGLDEAPDTAPPKGGFAGLMKTAAKEWPEARIRTVDLDQGESPKELAVQLLAELASDDTRLEVGYAEGVRRSLTPKEEILKATDSLDLGLSPESVVVITGGARGITGGVARALAELGQPRLVLLGRSPLPADEQESQELAAARDLKSLRQVLAAAQSELPLPKIDQAARRILGAREVRENLAACRSAGAKVEYHSVDVRDAEAFGELLEGLYDRYGRIDGVIHGAGVIEDRLLKDKDLESFRRVYETKVLGARCIADHLRPEARFVVFFSSVAGVFGNRGQSDYAAANDMLDKLAARLNRRIEGRALSVNWGPWAATGADSSMVSDALADEYARQGVGLIEGADGVHCLLAELGSDSSHSQVILMRADPEPFLPQGRG